MQNLVKIWIKVRVFNGSVIQILSAVNSPQVKLEIHYVVFYVDTIILK